MTDRLVNRAAIAMWFYGWALMTGVYVKKYGLVALLDPASAGLDPITFQAWGIQVWLTGTIGWAMVKTFYNG